VKEDCCHRGLCLAYLVIPASVAVYCPGGDREEGIHSEATVIEGALDQTAVKEVVDKVLTRLYPIAVILGATSTMCWRIEYSI
jgi:hypothetical protein